MTRASLVYELENVRATTLLSITSKTHVWSQLACIREFFERAI